MGQVKTQNL